MSIQRPTINRLLPALLGPLIASTAFAAPPGLSFTGLPRQAATLAEVRDPTSGSVHSQAFVLDRAQRVRMEAVGADFETARRMSHPRHFIARLVMHFVRSAERFDDEVWPANAWILDANTRAVVWELRNAGTDRNRDGLDAFDGEIELPRGTYEVYYSFFPPQVWRDHGGRHWFTNNGPGFRSAGLRIRGDGRALGEVRPPAEAEPGVIVAFHGLGDDAQERIGFMLERATDVEIRAIGEAGPGTTYDYGWLINADTRERVWEFTYNQSEAAGGAAKNRLSFTRMRLPAGRYAAFFVTDGSHSPASWNAPPPYDPSAYGLSIRVADRAARAAFRTFTYEPAPRDQAIAALTGVGDSEYRSQGFTVARPVGLRVFALGEGRRDQMFDYAWITNAATGQPVWEMTHDLTEHAGGGSKNRLFDGIIRLEPGNYMVHYVSDDSHAAGNWNDAPPADRDYWGVSLLLLDARDRAAISDYDPAADPSIAARLVGMRDGQVARRRFSMDRDGAVRVYALGEGSGGTMYDYAYIQDSRTGRRVWEMSYQDTDHAGGASKNRVFDGSIRLPAGEYELVYRTDDSHAFGAWNSTPPRDFTNWGVTVYRTAH